MAHLAPDTVDLSIVLCTYNMHRELPRTLCTLSRAYQRYAQGIRFEVIIVDNGSDKTADDSRWVDLGCSNVDYLYVPRGDPSPCRILNQGIARAHGRLVAVMIDGARMLSPGVFHLAMLAGAMHDRPVICTHGFHLGPELQARSIANGYNQAAEDALLASVDWQHNGYRLFEISVFAGSSYRGWLVSPNESNCLILPRKFLGELGGFDERFVTPGGGLANLDLFQRACQSRGAQLVTLLGEGTFHQIHGGAAANSSAPNPNEAFDQEYERLRGQRFQTITHDSILIGRPNPSTAQLLEQSARLLRNQPHP